MMDAARTYLARGWSILALWPKNKRPLIDWEPLQRARPPGCEAVRRFTRWPSANIGIVTGEISNLIVTRLHEEGTA
jgi:hypothetical protein